MGGWLVKKIRQAKAILRIVVVLEVHENTQIIKVPVALKTLKTLETLQIMERLRNRNCKGMNEHAII